MSFKLLTTCLQEYNGSKLVVRQNWFSPHIALVDTDVYNNGATVFMPISLIFNTCVVIIDQIKFDLISCICLDFFFMILKQYISHN